MSNLGNLTHGIFRLVLLIAAILVTGAGALRSQTETAPAPEPDGLKILESIQIDQDVMPYGLVIAEQAMWMIDTKRRALDKFDIERKEIVSTIPLEIGDPRGLTWDGKTFWIVDNREKAVHQIDPDKGSLLRTIPVPIDTDREKAVLEAAAFDGKHLWVAYFAGWSSKILRIDPETGEVLQSMFANGHPRALATDGKHLWMISYNQGRYTGVISERTIMDDADRMNLTKKYVARTPGKEPAGMAYDGQYLWISDREKKDILKVELPQITIPK